MQHHWRRIHVIGNSSSGKSTLAAQLSRTLDIPLVELDALNWEPDWVGLNATNPREFERRIAAATSGEAWVAAGSYTAFAQRIFWPRVQLVVWLDLPMPLLLTRMLRRSWRRWRTNELLWGTNYESFWTHFRVWRREESLIWWIVTQHGRKRRQMQSFMARSEFSHIHFVRLASPAEIEQFRRTLDDGAPVSLAN